MEKPYEFAEYEIQLDIMYVKCLHYNKTLPKNNKVDCEYFYNQTKQVFKSSFQEQISTTNNTTQNKTK